MLERFTLQARQVLTLAVEEAKASNHTFTNTAHLLLGLTYSPSERGHAAAKILSTLDVSYDRVRVLYDEFYSQEDTTISGGKRSKKDPYPLNQSVWEVFKISQHEALQLGHNYIGTEDILLGLMRYGEWYGECHGTQILVACGADFEEIRRGIADPLEGKDSYDGGSPRECPRGDLFEEVLKLNKRVDSLKTCSLINREHIESLRIQIWLNILSLLLFVRPDESVTFVEYLKEAYNLGKITKKEFNGCINVLSLVGKECADDPYVTEFSMSKADIQSVRRARELLYDESIEESFENLDMLIKSRTKSFEDQAGLREAERFLLIAQSKRWKSWTQLIDTLYTQSLRVSFLRELNFLTAD